MPGDDVESAEDDVERADCPHSIMTSASYVGFNPNASASSAYECLRASWS